MAGAGSLALCSERAHGEDVERSSASTAPSDVRVCVVGAVRSPSARGTRSRPCDSRARASAAAIASEIAAGGGIGCSCDRCFVGVATAGGASSALSVGESFVRCVYDDVRFEPALCFRHFGVDFDTTLIEKSRLCVARETQQDARRAPNDGLAAQPHSTDDGKQCGQAATTPPGDGYRRPAERSDARREALTCLLFWHWLLQAKEEQGGVCVRR